MRGRPGRRRALLCATLLAWPVPRAHAEAADGAAVLASQPPELVATLREKHVVLEDRSEGHEHAVRGLVIFAQPMDRVFGLLTQSARQIEYRPELDSIQTVDRFADGTVDEHRMKIMLIRIRYRLRNHSDAATHRIWWELDPRFDNDLRRVTGSWELHALDGNETLGVFATEVELGAGMPSFLEDYVTRKNLPKTLERCRRWVDGNGQTR